MRKSLEYQEYRRIMPIFEINLEVNRKDILRCPCRIFVPSVGTNNEVTARQL